MIRSTLLTVTAVLGLAALLVDAPWRRETRVRSEDVDAFVAAIAGPARRGGRVIFEEVRPAIDGLKRDARGSDELRQRAMGWISEFQDLRKQFAAAPRAPGIEAVAKAYDDSLAAYLDAFTLIREMTAAGGDVDEVIAALRKADDAYDAAGELLAGVRRRAGLDPSDHL